MGEAAAACVAGALSLADAARVVCLRARLVRRLAGTGAMAAAELPRANAAALAARLGGGVVVAASNSPRAVLVAGAPAAVEAFVAAVEADGGFARRVKVDYASHCAHVDPLLAELRAALACVDPVESAVPFHSSVTGAPLDGRELRAAYWARNLREPVQFWETVRGLCAEGIDAFVEVSPHPVLVPALQEGVAELRVDAAALPSLRRGEDERAALLASLGALYARGADVAWEALEPPCPPVDLPRYPWQRERFWITDALPGAPPAAAVHAERAPPAAAAGHPLLGARTDLAAAPGAVVWQADVTGATAGLAGHRVQGAVAVPAAAYLEAALAAAAACGLSPEVHALELSRLLFVPDGESVRLQTVLEPAESGAATLRIFSGGPRGWTLHASARVGAAADATGAPSPAKLRSADGSLPAGVLFVPQSTAPPEADLSADSSHTAAWAPPTNGAASAGTLVSGDSIQPTASRNGSASPDAVPSKVGDDDLDATPSPNGSASPVAASLVDPRAFGKGVRGMNGSASAETPLSGDLDAAVSSADVRMTGGEAWIDVDAVRARCGEVVEADGFYAAAAGEGVELGAEFRRLAAVRRGAGEALAELAAGDPGEGAGYGFHPALIDACLQALAAAAAPADDGDGGAPSVPVSVARAVAFAPASAARRVHARAAEPDGGGGWGGDARLLDDAGRVVAEFSGVRFRRLDAPLRSDAALEEWLLRVDWIDQPLPPAADRPADGAWVLCAPSADAVSALSAALEDAGEPCAVVRMDGDAAEVDAHALRDAIESAGGARCRGVVHLRGLAASGEEVDADALLDGAARGAHEVAGIVRVLAEMDAPPRLWIATRGAVAVADGDAAAAPAAAPLWGVGRTAALEHPTLRCTLVDVDGGAAEGAAALARELAAGAGGDQVAWRGGRRRVPRLARATLAAAGGASPAAPPPLRADGWYLVTGGLGALGLEVAEWMAAHGARTLALLGRAAPAPAAAARVEALRRAGVEVRVISASVACRRELAAALEEAGRGLPPLRGVVHAAGEMRDATLLTATAADARAVLAPKVAGGWNLHALTAGRALDFFVLFSSTAATLGAPGQAAYAGANAFLDALAAHRRAGGDAAVSLAWGGWARVGLAARADRGGRLEARGVGSIPPADGVRLFGALRGAAAAHLLVLPLDVARWRQAHAGADKQPLFAALLAAQPAAAVRSLEDTGGTVREALLALPAGPARRARLEEAVQRDVAAVVGARAGRMDPRDPLSVLGIDSLMALEIRNRLEAGLGVRLPATVLWRFPSLGALAAHLAGEMGVPLDAPAAHPSESDDAEPDGGADGAALHGLSAEALGELLARELASAPTPTARG
jgi:acyl transferase domain-containing protein/acyl carrier protein